MEKIKNLPAFPCKVVRQELNRGSLVADIHEETGLTLLDYFAGKAMQGLMWQITERTKFSDVVGDAYKVAEAMLKEREKYE